MRSIVRTLLFVLVGSMGVVNAFAQNGTIAGRVLDPESIPLPGASVMLVGTTYGTATDLEGLFSFEAPAGEYTLRVSFVGYGEYEAPVVVTPNETLEVNIQLEEGAIGLDEVVVTALGIQREERSLGYSFQEVEPDAIQKAGVSNLVGALAGKVAGLQVSSSSGQPGKAPRITIRGISSMTGNNQPLFVVDGIPISNDEDDNIDANILFTGGTANRAVDIDPNIIEDITVLKGASAMALYGTRAANGAILITTRGGRQYGPNRGPQISFSTSTRWDEAIIDGFQNEYAQGNFGCFYNGLPRDRGGFVDAECLARVQGGSPDDYKDLDPQVTRVWGPHIDSLNANRALLDALGVDRIEVFDPRDAFYQTGAVIENNLSISGGALGGSYFLSGSYLDQQGIVPGTLLDRASFLGKFDADLSERLSARVSVNYVRTENDWVAEGNGPGSYLYSLNFAPATFDITEYVFEDNTQRNYNATLNNPLWHVKNNKYTSDVDRFISGATIDYRIFPWLTVSERIGLDTYTDTRKGMVNVGSRSNPDGSMYDNTLTRKEINSDLMLRADREFGETWGLDAIAGWNLNSQYNQYVYVQGQKLGIPDFFNIGNAATVTGNENRYRRRLHGLYANVTADYADWAYLTLTARNDWSSTLPAGNNSYFYPSASVGLVFTEAMNLFENTPLSFGKIRASWARIGNDAPVYATTTTFIQANPGDGQRGDILFPFNGVNGYLESNVLGNPNLKPELSSEYEVGLDLRFFGQRARLDAAYYHRITTNQIFDVPVSAATGYVSQLMNAGEIRNQGFELVLGFTPVESRNFIWDVQANFTRNRTDVLKLAEGVESIFLAGFTDIQVRAEEGDKGYGTIWGEQFWRADPEADAALFEQYPELEEGMLIIGEDGLPLSNGTYGTIGNVQPDWLGNLRTTFTAYGLTLGALLDIRQGGDILNMDKYYSTFYGSAEVTADRGSKMTYEGFNLATGRMNDVEVVKDRAYYQNFYSFYAENWIEEASFMKLRELSLSYAVPRSMTQRIGVDGLTITATGRNLWIKSDFSYGDPEGSLMGSGNGQGFYHMVTPSTKSFSLGVRLTL